MKEKVKSIFGSVICVILVVGVLLYLAVTAIMDLTNKADTHTITVMQGCEALEVKHKINGIIPKGTDHFYLAIDDEDQFLIIKAPKNWALENFDSNCYSLLENGLVVTGILREQKDFKARNAFSDIWKEMGSTDKAFGDFEYLDLGYVKSSVMKLIVFAIFLIVIAMGLAMIKFNITFSQTMLRIWLVLLIVGCVLLIIIL